MVKICTSKYGYHSVLGYYEGPELKFVGKVRSGFVPHTRRDVYKRFEALKIDKCPLVNLPEKRRTMWALTANEMKECRWLKPVTVAQFEFVEWTPKNHLRHSKFVALREDKEASDVIRES